MHNFMHTVTARVSSVVVLFSLHNMNFFHKDEAPSGTFSFSGLSDYSKIGLSSGGVCVTVCVSIVSGVIRRDFERGLVEMTNEIVEFKKDGGEVVRFTAREVHELICPQATKEEIALFMALCQAQKLNPLIKDAYLVKYGNAPASMITGKEVFTKRANANPNFEGMEHGVVFMRKTPQGVTVDKREGAAVYKAAGETLLGGWARVFVKGKKPVYAELALDEYSTGKSNWNKMPAVMINKCAQVAALRLAFPDAFQGLYAAEEMGNAGEAVLQRETAPEPVRTPSQPMMNDEPLQVHFVEMISDAQNDELTEKCCRFAMLRGVEPNAVFDALFASETLRAAGAIVGEMLTFEQAGLALKLLDNWIAKAEAAQIEKGFEASQDEPQGYETPLAASMAAARAAYAEGDQLESEDIQF